MLAVILLMGPPSGRCQAPEAGLKAAYTLNFAKFAEWPAGYLRGDLRVCVAGRSLVGEALEESAASQVAGHDLKVSYVHLPGDVSGCHLLFVSKLDMARAPRLLAALAELPILTVSDIEGFAAEGGMIELLVVERKLRFDINLDAVRAAGLRLAPKLLKLAHRIRGHVAAGDD